MNGMEAQFVKKAKKEIYVFPWRVLNRNPCFHLFTVCTKSVAVVVVNNLHTKSQTKSECHSCYFS